MNHVLVLFLDGVGLGDDDPDVNPFAAADMPALEGALDGRKLLRSTAPFHGEHATLVSVDANLGVSGNPQSATGQGTLLTGRNLPQELGRHYGPKPNAAIAESLTEDNLFQTVVRRSGSAALLNAYPPSYFEAVDSGRRLYSAIPLAVSTAGLSLMTADDLQNGRALSADFTGQGWSERPDFPPTPIYMPSEAGRLLARIASEYHLSWFDYWPSDYVGHRGTMPQAISLLEMFDAVFQGLFGAWRRQRDLFVLISDHGNLEDMHARGHTRNPVPALMVGPERTRQDFAQHLRNLTDFMSAVLNAIFQNP
jgi:2,3-bisphosphoglycerate-independent phosphoglycerate mutase